MTRLRNAEGLDFVHRGVTMSRLMCLVRSTVPIVVMVSLRGELLIMSGMPDPLSVLRDVLDRREPDRLDRPELVPKSVSDEYLVNDSGSVTVYSVVV